MSSIIPWGSAHRKRGLSPEQEYERLGFGRRHGKLVAVKGTNVSYYVLDWALDAVLGRGFVEIEGEGLDAKVEIEANVAQVLARIPDEGLTIEKAGHMFRAVSTETIQGWLDGTLLQKGLVEKQGPLYKLSRAALEARYTLFPAIF